ncbi:hypothetical protein PVAND_003250 [Polypedilum vanderplanki]|uniref:HTH CENPB-type domain-containing protein n=1 Tax=Polypedilum vanderplanki TaxID=319348 RepID=A0A9J6BTG8_POLVA|nr:hypothetical protein PVAND_003250 [Polypedilum vanderplanki]
MLESIIKSEQAIRETLNDFNANNLLDSVDFAALHNLYNAMEPIKLAVERLSQEDATLGSADIILEFMFKKLLTINSEISKELHDNLKKRIDERLNKDVMNLLKSLKDPSVPPSKFTLTFAGRLASRLFGFNDGNDEDEFSQPDESDNINLSLKDELNLLLYKDQTSTTIGSDFKWLKSEFTLYKNTGQRTENLQKIYNALLSIKPTSTDVERVFSICTNFCTKIRSRLQQIISEESEKELADWVIEHAERGDPLLKTDVLQAATQFDMLQNNPPRFGKDGPSKKWFNNFMSRNPKITFRKPEPLGKAAAVVCEEDVDRFFYYFRNWLEKNDLLHLLNRPEAFMNLDETGFDLNAAPNKVLAKRGAKTVYTVHSAKVHDRITVTFCFNAAGETLRPQIIFKKNFSGLLQVAYASGQAGTDFLFCKSEDGWQTQSTFFEYVKKLEDQDLTNKNIERPVIIFVMVISLTSTMNSSNGAKRDKSLS